MESPTVDISHLEGNRFFVRVQHVAAEPSEPACAEIASFQRLPITQSRAEQAILVGLARQFHRHVKKRRHLQIRAEAPRPVVLLDVRDEPSPVGPQVGARSRSQLREIGIEAAGDRRKAMAIELAVLQRVKSSRQRRASLTRSNIAVPSATDSRKMTSSRLISALMRTSRLPKLVISACRSPPVCARGVANAFKRCTRREKIVSSPRASRIAEG
jgi:hypothetical protein